MKKILCMFLTGCYLVFMAACGSQRDEPATTVSDIETTTTTEVTTTSEATTTTEQTTTTEETTNPREERVNGAVIIHEDNHDEKIYDEPITMIDNSDVKICLTKIVIPDDETGTGVALFYSVENKTSDKYVDVQAINSICLEKTQYLCYSACGPVLPGMIWPEAELKVYETGEIDSFEELKEVSGSMNVYVHKEQYIFYGSEGKDIKISLNLENYDESSNEPAS